MPCCLCGLCGLCGFADKLPNNFQNTPSAIFSSHAGAGEGIWFSFRGVAYQNNSLVTLQDIGEWGDALFCVTDSTACCRSGVNMPAIGNWYFPNGTRMPSSGFQWDIHRTRGQSVYFNTGEEVETMESTAV